MNFTEAQRKMIADKVKLLDQVIERKGKKESFLSSLFECGDRSGGWSVTHGKYRIHRGRHSPAMIFWAEEQPQLKRDNKGVVFFASALFLKDFYTLREIHEIEGREFYQTINSKDLQKNPKVISLRNFGDKGKAIPIERIVKDVQTAMDVRDMFEGCVTEQDEEKLSRWLEDSFEKPAIEEYGQQYLDKVLEIAKETVK